MEQLACSSGSMIHSVTNCSLCTYYVSHTLTKERNSTVPFFCGIQTCSHQTQDMQMRYHFIFFYNSLLFQAHTNTVVEIRPPLTPLPWVVSNFQGT